MNSNDDPTQPRFCIALAYNDPRDMCSLAVAAEEAGFSAVVLSDHLVYPAQLETPYPYTRNGAPRWAPETPWPDPLVTVGAMASVTRTLEFITSVYVLSMRHPVQAAKSIATAAVLSDDRLILGVAAGWMREEFELLGVDFEGRGGRLDESIDVVRTLLRGESVGYSGRHFQFDPVEMHPVPDRPLPIWGGGLSPPALRRAAKLCDGWLSEVQSESEIVQTLAELRALRADSPRADLPFSVCAALTDVVDVDGYRRLGEAGVTHLITVPWLFYGRPESLEDKIDGLRRFADDVLQHFAPAT